MMDWRDQLQDIKDKLSLLEPTNKKQAVNPDASASATKVQSTVARQTAHVQNTAQRTPGKRGAPQQKKTPDSARKNTDRSSGRNAKSKAVLKYENRVQKLRSKYKAPEYHLISDLHKSNSDKSSIQVMPKTLDNNTVHATPDVEPFTPEQYQQSDFITSLLSKSAQTLKFEVPLDIDAATKKQLVIGLDFGTAFTKVVVGDVTYAYAVPFDEHGYLLPSQLHIDKHGNCSTNKDNCVETISDLKLPIILSQVFNAQLYAVITFLALVMSRCRAWVNNSQVFGRQPIRWLLNAGLPAASYDDVKLTDLYKKLMQTAWSLSYSNSINLNVAQQLWHADLVSLVPKGIYLPVSHFALFPEFIAQIVGYVQSPSRRKFSHLLVDVGAGTLDVAFFTVRYEDGEWVFYTYGQRVQPLGVEMLYRHRLMMLGSDAKLDNAALPSSAKFMYRFSLSRKKLNKIDDAFMNSVSRCIFDTLKDSDQNYLGGAVGPFAEKITTFLCGGGASISNYSEVFKFTPDRYPLEMYKLPVPSRLMTKGIGTNLYHRLSVAYGLSYDAFNIGQVRKQQRDLPGQKMSDGLQNASDYILNGDAT